VPVTNGAIPVAPGGGQSSQAGTLLETGCAAVPPADDRLETGEAAGADLAGPAPVARPPAEEAFVVELLSPRAAADGVVIPGNVTAPYGLARRVPAMPEVWAEAGAAKLTISRNAV
jgi:hypothetical protein